MHFFIARDPSMHLKMQRKSQASHCTFARFVNGGVLALLLLATLTLACSRFSRRREATSIWPFRCRAPQTTMSTTLAT